MTHILCSVDNMLKDSTVIDKSADHLKNIEEGKLSVVYIAEQKVRYYNGKIISQEDNNNVPDSFKDRSYEDFDYNFEKITTNGKSKVESLINYVDNEDIDHIYVGHRNLPTKTENHVGSFAKELLGKSEVPVTVIPTD